MTSPKIKIQHEAFQPTPESSQKRMENGKGWGEKFISCCRQTDWQGSKSPGPIKYKGTLCNSRSPWAANSWRAGRCHIPTCYFFPFPDTQYCSVRSDTDVAQPQSGAHVLQMGQRNNRYKNCAMLALRAGRNTGNKGSACLFVLNHPLNAVVSDRKKTRNG